MGAFTRSLVVTGEAGGPVQGSGVHLPPPSPPGLCGGSLQRSGLHGRFDSIFKRLFILMYLQIL